MPGNGDFMRKLLPRIDEMKASRSIAIGACTAKKMASSLASLSEPTDN